MSDTVRVPAEKIAALRAEANQFGPPTGLVPTPVTVGLLAAARAVVDAVETEAAPDELTALRKRIDRVAALTGGPLSDGHRPYAATIGTETQFVILLDDLRAALGDS